LQFFLNMVEFNMTVQQAVEAHNFTSFQMQSSFGDHQAEPGRLQVTYKVSEWVRSELGRMGYSVETVERTYSPVTAIWFDHANGTIWGGASEQGEDYGLAW
jgi:gamma-glutamyltranspeptidase/glutathione hydrolase